MILTCPCTMLYIICLTTVCKKCVLNVVNKFYWISGIGSLLVVILPKVYGVSPSINSSRVVVLCG